MDATRDWTLRIEEAVPTRWGAGVEAVAAAVKAKAAEYARRAGYEPEVIRLRLGACVPFRAEELESLVARLGRDSPIAHATLEIERVPARWSCSHCDRTSGTRTCAACKRPGVLVAGEEIVLDSIAGCGRTVFAADAGVTHA